MEFLLECLTRSLASEQSDVPSADWLSQTQVKINTILVVEIPIKHSSLHNKYVS